MLPGAGLLLLRLLQQHPVLLRNLLIAEPSSRGHESK
jgi:hypothetical protein